MAWSLALSADDSAAGVEAVCRGDVTVGISNPSALLTVARRGVPPFRGHAPVSAICVLPSPDQLVVACNAATGLASLEEVVERHFTLRLSVRGQRDNSVHVVVDHVLEASGLSVADLEAWGGSISFDEGLPSRGDRIKKVVRGEVDAIIDEASATWTEDAIEAGMRIIPLSETALIRLESWGYRRAVLSSSIYSSLKSDVPTIDFSGFAIYVRDDTPDQFVVAVCAALEARRERITLQTGEPLPLAEMCGDTDAAPLDVPLHPAAAEYWRERGYLKIL
jgi:hypothetical protein